MRICLLFLLFFVGLVPAQAAALDAAFDRAIAQFEKVRPDLPPMLYGVDTAAYRDALTLRQFSSSHWGGTLRLDVVATGSTQEPSCARFAAFVRLPPQNGSVTLVICPQFSSEGTDSLRALTILHEMVHVVAGPDECRAMAFAAHIEKRATGAFTPVDRYWQANGCTNSGFSLP